MPSTPPDSEIIGPEDDQLTRMCEKYGEKRISADETSKDAEGATVTTKVEYRIWVRANFFVTFPRPVLSRIRAIVFAILYAFTLVLTDPE